jgi:hypothetical protein
MDEAKPVGLPPPRDAALVPPSRQSMLMARIFNLFGLISPAANAGTFFVVPRDRRWFGLTAGWICAAVLVYALKTDRSALAATALGVHFALVLAGIANPLWVGAIAGAWIAFGTAIGKVMAYPMFTLIYLVAVTPTALLARAFGKDALGTRGPPRDSYWTPHTPPPKERYERQF